MKRAKIARMDSESLIPMAEQLRATAHEALTSLERDDQDNARTAVQAAAKVVNGLLLQLGAEPLALGETENPQ